jgi:phage-related protein
MNLIIKRLDGTEYSLREYGILVEDFSIDSPIPRTPTQVIEGRPGFIDLGTVYEGRTMTAKLGMIAQDAADYPLLRNELFRILDSREYFYLISSNEPGKRWLVKADGFTVSKVLRHAGKFNVNFISSSPYSETIGTTLDPVTFDAELWQTGGGLELEESDYIHTTSTFQIYNASDGVEINPRYMPLEIEFIGASTNLKIENATTGDAWEYTGNSNATDSILLDGVRSTKNGLSIFSDTNRKLITIAPGNNDFVITGATGDFTISFGFRYYLL